METEIATIDTQSIVRTFDDALREMAKMTAELKAMQPSPTKARLALEYAQYAKRYMEEVDVSPLTAHKQRLHEAHRFISGAINRIRKPAEVFFKFCNDTRSECEVVRRLKIETERQKREAEANRLAQEARQAEVAHLREIGKLQEAEARAEAPLTAVTVSVNEDAGKPTGEMFVEVWVPRRDDSGEVCFSDRTAYLKWIAERPEMHHLIDHNYGRIKKLLTDNRGLVQPPGLIVEHKFEPRTRKEVTDE